MNIEKRRLLDEVLGLATQGVVLLGDDNDTVIYRSPVMRTWFSDRFIEGERMSRDWPDFRPLDVPDAMLGKKVISWVTDARPQQGRSFPVEGRLIAPTNSGSTEDGNRAARIVFSDYSRVREKEFMLKSFSAVIDENNRRIKKDKKKIEDLLNSMRQAVFAVNFDGLITEPVSRFASEVFGFDVAHKSVFETVYSGIQDQSDVIAQIRSALVSVAGEDEIQWKSSERVFPSSLRFHRAGEERRLKVSTCPIWNEDDGTCQSLLYIVEDVTEVEKLTRQVSVEKERNLVNLQMIQELVDLDRGVTQSFLNDSAEELRRVQHELEKVSLRVEKTESRSVSLDPELIASVSEMFRVIHTLKGNARTLRLGLLGPVTHQLEQVLDEVRKSRTWSLALAREANQLLSEVRSKLLGYGEIARRVLGVEDRFQRELLRDLQRLLDEFDISVSTTVSFSDGPGKSVVYEEVMRNAHRLKAGMRYLHSLKGLLRMVDRGSDLDRVHRIESSIGLLASGSVGDREPGELLQEILEDYRVVAASVRKDFVGNHAGLRESEFSQALSHLQSVSREETRLPEFHHAVAVFQSFDLQSLAQLLGFAEERISRGQEISEILATLKDWTEFLGLLARGAGSGEAVIPVGVRQLLMRGTSISAVLAELKGSDFIAIASVVALCQVLERTSSLILQLRAPLGCTSLMVDLIRFLQVQDEKVSSDSDRGGSRSRHSPALVSVVERNYEEVLKYFDHLEERTDLGLKLRQLPLSGLLSRFEPMVLDLARSLGKAVEFRWTGGELLLDRSKQGVLQEVLLHVLRNSVDHGVEGKDERLTHQKPQGGLISVTVAHKPATPASEDAPYLEVEVCDDGRGIRREALKQKAVRLGLIEESGVGNLNDSEVLELIFLPGLSTAEVVTSVSGRGVGMDVVKTSIQKLKGQIHIESLEGKYTKLRFSFPV